MCGRNLVLAAALIITPLGAQAADLVVWWEKGQYEEEDQAVREIVAAFEQETGKQVELVLEKQAKLRDDTLAAIEAERPPPDFIFTVINIQHYERWAYEGRLVELTEAFGPMRELFDPDALERVTLVDGTTGERGLYMVPMGFAVHHVHVWKNLLERAGFTLEDIPKDWDAFWAFWCDQVQPAVRTALARDDVWGIGLSMSADSVDTRNGIYQFIDAYEADYVTRDGRLVIDDPEVRRRLIKAVDSYTQIYRKGCTPPESITWEAYSNNEEFLAQNIVMTLNQTLSITNALKATRPEDYYDNAATIDWPDDAYGQPLPIEISVQRAVVFKDGLHVATAKEFVTFLIAEGWLAHLSRLRGRAHAAADAEAARSAVLAGPGRPAPDALGHAASDPATQPQLRACHGRLAAQQGQPGERLAEGHSPRRCWGTHPRAGGRRGDRAGQADFERIAKRPSRRVTESAQVWMWLQAAVPPRCPARPL
jgi:multiple sugar transport system substrate-binding protein